MVANCEKSYAGRMAAISRCDFEVMAALNRLLSAGCWANHAKTPSLCRWANADSPVRTECAKSPTASQKMGRPSMRM